MNARAQHKAIVSLLCALVAAIFVVSGCTQSAERGEPTSESPNAQVEVNSTTSGTNDEGTNGEMDTTGGDVGDTSEDADSDVDSGESIGDDVVDGKSIGSEAGNDALGASNTNNEAAPSEQSSDNPAMNNFDIGESANRAAVNERLSWMAQAFCYDSGRIDLKDTDVQTDFALSYIGITNRDAFEAGEFKLDGIQGDVSGKLDKRVPTSVVAEVVLDYLGEHYRAVKLEEPFATDGRFVYCTVTAPYGQTAAYSAVKSLDNMGEGRYKAKFDIFIDYMPYGQKGETFFQLEPEAMMAELGMNKPSASGEAVLRITDKDGMPHIVIEEYSIGNAKTTSTTSR